MNSSSHLSHKLNHPNVTKSIVEMPIYTRTSQAMEEDALTEEHFISSSDNLNVTNSII